MSDILNPNTSNAGKLNNPVDKPSDSSNTSGAASSNNNAHSDNNNQPQKWSSESKNVNNRQKMLTIHETNGDTIELHIQWLGRKRSENILNTDYVNFQDDTNHTVTQARDGDFHEALLPMFMTAKITNKDGKVQNEPVNFDFFDKHEKQTYDYAMTQATNFCFSGPNRD